MENTGSGMIATPARTNVTGRGDLPTMFRVGREPAGIALRMPAKG